MNNMASTPNTDFTIEQVLPHKAPMILIDKLLSFGEKKGQCSQTITTSSLFYDEKLQGVPSYVGIEYMAQSIAAYANAHELINGRPVEVGFLVSTRKFSCEDNIFKLGQLLIIDVERLYKDDSGLSAFSCTISINGKVVVTATINVFQPENPSEFLASQV